MTKGKTKVSVCYPTEEGSNFDMEYYLSSHIPMVKRLLGHALIDVSVDKGLGGARPGDPAPYMSVANMFFDSIEAFQTAFGPNAEQILADIPNYTNVQPVVQISEVVA